VTVTSLYRCGTVEVLIKHEFISLNWEHENLEHLESRAIRHLATTPDHAWGTPTLYCPAIR
jgi:hypothetical protein